MPKAKILSEVSGIYCILNTANGKRYIGQTVDFSKRLSMHRLSLEAGEHPSRHLQAAYNKYGRDAFQYLIIETCSAEDLFKREAYWIDYYKSNNGDFGYNLRMAQSTNFGLKMSEETRRRMSAAHKNRPKNPESVRKSAESRRGTKRTASQRKLMALSVKKTDEHKVRIIKGLLRDETLTQQEIADAVGCSQKYVWRIKMNEILWAIDVEAAPDDELPNVVRSERVPGTTKAIPKKRLSIDTVRQVLTLNRVDGLGAHRCSKLLGISKSSCEAIITGTLKWAKDSGVYQEFDK